MFGCSTFREVRASRWKPSTNSLSNARENGSTLMATSRSSSFSFALKTTGFRDAVDRDDVRVFELRGGTGFALEALDELFVEREGERQHFDGDFPLQLLLFCLEDDRHAPAAELLEDLVLRVELLADHVDFGDFLRLGDGADGRRRGQIEAARVTELRSVLVLGATARAVHPVSEGAGPNLGFVGRPVNNLKAL